MVNENRRSWPGLWHVLRENALISRRQVFRLFAALGLALSALPFRGSKALAGRGREPGGKESTVKLTSPGEDGKMSLERAIGRRRTVRSFADMPITPEQLSQLCWAAQGITDKVGFKRAAPSGGALYPADLYVVTGKETVKGMDAGVYRHLSGDHCIARVCEGDRRKDLGAAALGQMWMAEAATLFVVTVEYSRITFKYGERGVRYAMIEVGHIGQNILLQAQTLGLSAGIVGAFKDEEVGEILGAPRKHEPLIILPVGWPG